MSTQQIADQLVGMCRQGQNLGVIEQLYADNVISREMPGTPAEVSTGIKEVFAKSEQWLNNVEEFHHTEVSDPVVAGNHFAVKMDFDVTFKDRGRQQMEEVCVYEVKDGKIASEQFFYSMPEM